MESGAPNLFTTSVSVVCPSVMKDTVWGVSGVLMVRRATLQPDKGIISIAAKRNVRETVLGNTASVSEGPEPELQIFSALRRDHIFHDSIAIDDDKQVVAFD